MGLDSNWIVTGFDNAPEARRRVDAFHCQPADPGLGRLGVTLGHGPSVYVIFDRLLRWAGRGTPYPAVDELTAAIAAAFPGGPVYYTHDNVGFELAAGDLTVEGAIASSEAALVS